MAELPPVGESNYPRGEVTRPYGSADRLAALWRAYVALSWLGVIDILLVFGWRDVFVEYRAYALLALVGLLVISTSLSLWPARNLAVAFEWPAGMGYLCAFVLGLQTIICCGFIGIVGLIVAIASEMTRYGLGNGYRGLRRSWIKVAVARRRELEAREAEGSRTVE